MDEKDLRQDVAAIGRIEAVPIILDVVCRITGMGFAAIARVTEDRWIACAVRDEIAFGLRPGGELKVETTICNEIRAGAEPVIIDDVAGDAVYCRHPTPAMYGFRSYISLPIRRGGGEFFGTLCAIDPRPARVNTPETIGMFRLFADLIGFHLDQADRLARSEAALLDARETAELREQFIAVLGHDLRNPLASVAAGIGLLRKGGLDARSNEVVTLMQASLRRMSTLVDDVMDFARGRLGRGMIVGPGIDTDLAPVLEQLVAETRTAFPDRDIRADIRLDRPVRCDPARIAQLLSNLLANALTHGAADQPVRIVGGMRGGDVELSVSNGGDPIPPATVARLFQPFFRATARPNAPGLGLGLYIASEIARAHGGAIAIRSTTEETRFTLHMPTGGAPVA